MKFYHTLLILLLSQYLLTAQDCMCTLSEVETNTVNSCDRIVGTVIEVSTVEELQNAVNEVNNLGGNRTILIADGTYPISSTAWFPYITASDVVIRSQSGNRDAVILTGQGMTSVAPDSEHGIYAAGDNITIADLTIKEVGNHGIALHGDNLLVHNVRIQNAYEQMIKGNNVGDGADNGVVQCSLLEYPAGAGPQFYIGGLDIHGGNNWRVSDNIFRNIASPSVSLAEHAVHFWNGSGDNIVERNQIINCDRGIGFGLGSSPNTGGIIRNNMIYNDGTGLFNDVGIGLESSPQTKVYNNTVFISYQNAIEYRFEETVGVDIRNNLCNRLIKSRNGGHATLGVNYEEAQADWFVNAAAGDLRLIEMQENVTDTGEDLTNEVLVDLDQNTRPQGSGYDLGAQELLTETTLTTDNVYCKNIVFPNPTTGVLTFAGTATRIAVTDVRGKEVFSAANVSNADLSELTSGLYFLRIEDERGREEVVRIVKE